ncbi:unnamed protein product [Amaranthus hypochondriacus]
MDDLPVEVIGNILSKLGAVRDVVLASATCRKWLEAWRNHMHSLSFNSNDWPVYHDRLPERLEIIITQIVFQTLGLRCLSIVMDDADEFSAAPVIAWLLYTRNSLSELYYNIKTTPNVNVLERCGRHKLEILTLAHNFIVGVEPSYMKFPLLRSLSLSYVSISALDLSLLLVVCPKLEVLRLVNNDISISDAHSSLELVSSSLKDVCIEDMRMDKVMLMADNIEKLHLKDCTFEWFLLVGKGGLRILEIDDVSAFHFDFGENTENLEVVDVSNFTILWVEFYRMISRAQNLRKLRLWRVEFEDEVVDLETIASCFLRLRYLSLSYDLRDTMLHYGFQPRSLSYDSRDIVLHYGFPRQSPLKNVVVLELGWTEINDLFAEWLSMLVERCPRLEKLIIYGALSRVTAHEECNVLARFTSSVVELMRIYSHVDVVFSFD